MLYGHSRQAETVLLQPERIGFIVEELCEGSQKHPHKAQNKERTRGKGILSQPPVESLLPFGNPALILHDLSKRNYRTKKYRWTLTYTFGVYGCTFGFQNLPSKRVGGFYFVIFISHLLLIIELLRERCSAGVLRKLTRLFYPRFWYLFHSGVIALTSQCPLRDDSCLLRQQPQHVLLSV